SIAALIGIFVLYQVGTWYKHHGTRKSTARAVAMEGPPVSKRIIRRSLAVLMALVFSKYFYLASLTSYYEFFLISKFHVSVRSAQIYLFLFLGAVAAGTIIGGPVGDRLGRKVVIWCSILGVLPFTLALPYANLLWTAILSAVVGVIRNFGVRAGTGAGKGRHDFGTFLRPRVRHGRHWRGRAGLDGGPHRHRLRLQSLLVPAGDGTAHRAPA